MEEIEKDSKNEKKATKIDKKNKPRGVWRKKKITPVDALEAAETQNIGKHLYNAVIDNEKREGERPLKTNDDDFDIIPFKNIESEVKPTTADIATTIIPEPTVEDTRTSMFEDARKAFEEFLSTEDDSDDVANMEEEDEKIERESTTTTQIPTTEEPITTTTIPPTSSTIESETSKPQITKEKKQVKTSTSQKVTGEICFRGRCIKTEE